MNRARLTMNSARDASPAWSPNGKKIAFFSARSGANQMYLMNSDGSNQSPVSNTAFASGGEPEWQPCPDGTCASYVETLPPASTITTPVYGDSYSPSNLTDFVGTATDEGLGVSQVQIALRQKRVDGSCRWWGGSSFVVGKCGAQLWRKAKGRDAWSYHLSSLLRKSVGTKIAGYTLFSRAKDYAGNVESSFVTGVNRLPFEIE
jgi:TolB protein